MRWADEQRNHSGHERYSAASFGTSPEDVAPADLLARVRQGGTAVRRRERGLSALSAAHDGVGTGGPRAPSHRTAHPPSPFPRGQEPGQLSVSGHSLAE